jgi:hypothetical protein
MVRLSRNFKIDLNRQARSELEELYLNDEKQTAALEWRKHLLARKANEVATVPKPGSDAVVPVTTPNYEISKLKYMNLIQQRESSGLKSSMVNVVNYEGKQITFLSAPYQSLSFKTLWKFMLDSRPDLIIAPIRPDTALDNFSIAKYSIENSGDKLELDATKYIKQLVRKGTKFVII